MTLDATQRPVLCFADNASTAINGAGACMIRSSEAWQVIAARRISDMDSPFSHTHYRPLVDRDGKLHLATGDFQAGASSVYWTSWTGEKWTKGEYVMGGGGVLGSSFVDHLGVPVLSLGGSGGFGGIGGWLVVARYVDAAWKIDKVDDFVTGYFEGLALDDKNGIHAAYLSRQKFKYAKWSGSVWATEDTGVPAGTYYDPTIAVDPSGLVHIYANRDRGEGIYIHGTASQWSQAPVPQECQGRIIADRSQAPALIDIDLELNEVYRCRLDGTVWRRQALFSVRKSLDRFPLILVDNDGFTHLLVRPSVATRNRNPLYATNRPAGGAPTPTESPSTRASDTPTPSTTATVATTATAAMTDAPPTATSTAVASEPPSPTPATTPPPPTETPSAQVVYLPALHRGRAPDAMGPLQAGTRSRCETTHVSARSTRDPIDVW